MKFFHCDYYLCEILILTKVAGLDGDYQVGYFEMLQGNDFWGLNFALELGDSRYYHHKNFILNGTFHKFGGDFENCSVKSRFRVSGFELKLL